MLRVLPLVGMIIVAAPLGSAFADQQSARPAAIGQHANAAATPRHLRALRQHGARLRQRVIASERRISTLQARRDAAERDLEQARAAYERHVVELYKTGAGARIALLSDARSAGDAIDRTRILRQVARADRAALRSLIDARDAADAAAADIDQAVTTLAADQSRLGDIHDELVSFHEPTGPVSLDAISDAQPGGSAPNARHFFTTGPIPQIGYLPDSMLGTLPVIGGPVAAPTMPANLQPSGAMEAGIASWYGPGFDGRTTANGETYDQYAMTAAHPSLPFGTWVKVTTVTGRSAIVRINDRGPYVAGRIIDLSYAAAQTLGIDGTMAVQLQPLA